MATTYAKLAPRDAIVMALTEWDRNQSRRKSHNPYFLGIALGNLDYFDEYADPREFVLDSYNGRLVPFILKRSGMAALTDDEQRRTR